MKILSVPVPIQDIEPLCQKYHPYGGAGPSTAVYSFGVIENDHIVAGYVWRVPAPGTNQAIAKGTPGVVLGLSRMVAVPRDCRSLKHVSKPLKQQMNKSAKCGISWGVDRGRWPVLVTYSDESCGHTGYVYECSGWTPTARKRQPYATDEQGRRVSVYTNGGTRPHTGYHWITRWEHRLCGQGEEGAWMREHGWRHEPVPGRVWRSGRQAHRWVRRVGD